ncbi:hypothetical protein K402DRAFT_408718 [Aulographum hederae CBS 113979]|uniref:Uncharacterized protein n=1 Tax=Aulographum hederae CBS 113979 TaxID=1176131 RepID=A0A6G1GJG4_9PEZI|nr:hypothetical protein K402DRAFT_408718 [Aulographum hederae CBS 113979]
MAIFHHIKTGLGFMLIFCTVFTLFAKEKKEEKQEEKHDKKKKHQNEKVGFMHHHHSHGHVQPPPLAHHPSDRMSYPPRRMSNPNPYPPSGHERSRSRRPRSPPPVRTDSPDYYPAYEMMPQVSHSPSHACPHHRG